ncbi:hypothetical protein [Mycobacteroides abscessus]|uniref:hypothetical protein n=1 Tax=Mycobacteroides abscessus TaxID=36809 RepID=UPI001F177EC5|nr:hypothetical protein [Mycobacteroides abscessus]
MSPPEGTPSQRRQDAAPAEPVRSEPTPEVARSEPTPEVEDHQDPTPEPARSEPTPEVEDHQEPTPERGVPQAGPPGPPSSNLAVGYPLEAARNTLARKQARQAAQTESL